MDTPSQQRTDKNFSLNNLPLKDRFQLIDFSKRQLVLNKESHDQRVKSVIYGPGVSQTEIDIMEQVSNLRNPLINEFNPFKPFGDDDRIAQHMIGYKMDTVHEAQGDISDLKHQLHLIDNPPKPQLSQTQILINQMWLEINRIESKIFQYQHRQKKNESKGYKLMKNKPNLNPTTLKKKYETSTSPHRQHLKTELDHFGTIHENQILQELIDELRLGITQLERNLESLINRIMHHGGSENLAMNALIKQKYFQQTQKLTIKVKQLRQFQIKSNLINQIQNETLSGSQQRTQYKNYILPEFDILKENNTRGNDASLCKFELENLKVSHGFKENERFVSSKNDAQTKEKKRMNDFKQQKMRTMMYTPKDRDRGIKLLLSQRNLRKSVNSRDSQKGITSFQNIQSHKQIDGAGSHSTIIRERPSEVEPHKFVSGSVFKAGSGNIRVHKSTVIGVQPISNPEKENNLDQNKDEMASIIEFKDFQNTMIKRERLKTSQPRIPTLQSGQNLAASVPHQSNSIVNIAKLMNEAKSMNSSVISKPSNLRKIADPLEDMKKKQQRIKKQDKDSAESIINYQSTRTINTKNENIIKGPAQGLTSRKQKTRGNNQNVVNELFMDHDDSKTLGEQTNFYNTQSLHIFNSRIYSPNNAQGSSQNQNRQTLRSNINNEQSSNQPKYNSKSSKSLGNTYSNTLNYHNRRYAKRVNRKFKKQNTAERTQSSQSSSKVAFLINRSQLISNLKRNVSSHHITQQVQMNNQRQIELHMKTLLLNCVAISFQVTNVSTLLLPQHQKMIFEPCPTNELQIRTNTILSWIKNKQVLSILRKIIAEIEKFQQIFLTQDDPSNLNIFQFKDKILNKLQKDLTLSLCLDQSVFPDQQNDFIKIMQSSKQSTLQNLVEGNEDQYNSHHIFIEPQVQHVNIHNTLQSATNGQQTINKVIETDQENTWSSYEGVVSKEQANRVIQNNEKKLDQTQKTTNQESTPNQDISQVLRPQIQISEQFKHKNESKIFELDQQIVKNMANTSSFRPFQFFMESGSNQQKHHASNSNGTEVNTVYNIQTAMKHEYNFLGSMSPSQENGQDIIPSGLDMISKKDENEENFENSNIKIQNNIAEIFQNEYKDMPKRDLQNQKYKDRIQYQNNAQNLILNDDQRMITFINNYNSFNDQIRQKKININIPNMTLSPAVSNYEKNLQESIKIKSLKAKYALDPNFSGNTEFLGSSTRKKILNKPGDKQKTVEKLSQQTTLRKKNNDQTFIQRKTDMFFHHSGDKKDHHPQVSKINQKIMHLKRIQSAGHRHQFNMSHNKHQTKIEQAQQQVSQKALRDPTSYDRLQSSYVSKLNTNTKPVLNQRQNTTQNSMKMIKDMYSSTSDINSPKINSPLNIQSPVAAYAQSKNNSQCEIVSQVQNQNQVVQIQNNRQYSNVNNSRTNNTISESNHIVQTPAIGVLQQLFQQTTHDPNFPDNAPIQTQQEQESLIQSGNSSIKKIIKPKYFTTNRQNINKDLQFAHSQRKQLKQKIFQFLPNNKSFENVKQPDPMMSTGNLRSFNRLINTQRETKVISGTNSNNAITQQQQSYKEVNNGIASWAQSTNVQTSLNQILESLQKAQKEVSDAHQMKPPNILMQNKKLKSNSQKPQKNN